MQIVPVPPNNFANKTPEGKANTINALRTRRSGGKRGKGAPAITKAISERNRIFSDMLREFYTCNPKRLRKLMMSSIGHAEKGHARFAEFILDRLEGPVKHDPANQTTVNFNFISDADRERAKSVVDDILAMDKPIPQLPEASECLTVETSFSLETPDSKPQTTA